jgi:thioredoxin-related protein
MRKLYSKDFVIIEAKPPNQYPEGHEMRSLTSARYTPLFVFLDYRGKKVMQTRGFMNEAEAKALHQFVSTRAYRKGTFTTFTEAQPAN